MSIGVNLYLRANQSSPLSDYQVDQNWNAIKYAFSQAITTSGSVTSVSASVFTGLSVAVTNPTTTPAISITTSLTGFLKGNGSGFTAQATVNAATEISGVLKIANGGTNAAAYTSNTALIFNGTSFASSATTSTELGYLSGATSNIQTQLNSKQGTITVLPYANGGTNYAASSRQDLINNLTAVSGGTTGQVLTLNGLGNAVFADASIGDVTSVNGEVGDVLLTVSNTTNPFAWTGVNLNIPSASGSVTGLLSSSNWTTFNTVTTKMPLGGGTFTGSVYYPFYPTDGNELVNLNFVIATLNGLKYVTSANAGTTANINLASAPSTIDGVTLVLNDRVLVKSQTDATQNGIYIFNGALSAMTRSADANTSSELNALTIFVQSGTVNGNKTYTQITPNPVVGTDDIVFVLASTSGTYTEGLGIDIVANVISLDTAYTDTFYVPLARTININGTTQDLSANRTWTLAESQWTNETGGIAYTSNIGIGTTSLTVLGSGYIGMTIVGDNTAGRGGYLQLRRGATTSGIILANSSELNIDSQESKPITFGVGGATAMKLAVVLTGGGTQMVTADNNGQLGKTTIPTSSQWTTDANGIFYNGRIGVNKSAASAIYALDVSGSVLISGAASSLSLTMQDSNANAATGISIFNNLGNGASFTAYGSTYTPVATYDVAGGFSSVGGDAYAQVIGSAAGYYKIWAYNGSGYTETFKSTVGFSTFKNSFGISSYGTTLTVSSLLSASFYSYGLQGSGSPPTYTLPLITSDMVGKIYWFKFNPAGGTNPLTIACNASDVINVSGTTSIAYTGSESGAEYYAATTGLWLAATFGGGTTYTFSTGLTNTANTITSNLSTGVSGGQTAIGSTSTNSGLTLKATTGVGTTGADIIFQVGSNGATEAMRILNSGNVGIGTASPTSGLGATRFLHINSAGDSSLILQSTASNGTKFELVSTVFSSTGTLALYDVTNTTYRLTLKGARLGLSGVTAPTAFLHLPAGLSAANGAPLMFTNGTNLATPVAGAMEFSDSTGAAAIFFTRVAGTRAQVPVGSVTSNVVTTVDNTKSFNFYDPISNSVIKLAIIS